MFTPKELIQFMVVGLVFGIIIGRAIEHQIILQAIDEILKNSKHDFV
jgi:hypothetical protein